MMRPRTGQRNSGLEPEASACALVVSAEEAPCGVSAAVGCLSVSSSTAFFFTIGLAGAASAMTFVGAGAGATAVVTGAAAGVFAGCGDFGVLAAAELSPAS